MSITRLPQTFRNLSRLYAILRVLSRHGFGDVVARLGLERTWEGLKMRLSFGRWGRRQVEHFRTEERIRMAFEELGSTYVKFGQILATRPDLIPMSLIHELRKLQDHVPPFDPAVAKRTIEEEIGAKIDDVFSEFDEKPLAAASIAQVHRAKLKSGDEVVIKVQRPNLRALIDADLDLLHVLAELIEENLPEMRRWQPVAIVEEFDRSIHKEIDFGREAHNIKKFAKNFAGDPTIYAPRVYDDLSTQRVLTMEFLRGVKVNSDEIFKRPEIDRELVARNGIRVTLTQVFVHGFFHADPHPGN
ncbi:MAG: ABC1 kinase family protein, partial [Polyangiaceae bacterium]